MARGVVAFDLVDDGSIVYSNGNAVFHQQADGKRELLAKGAGITHLVAVRMPSLTPESRSHSPA